MILAALLLLMQAAAGDGAFQEANRLAKEGHCEQAEPIYVQISRTSPGSAAIFSALGQCQFHEKNYLAAAESFQQASSLDPADVSVASMRGAALAMAGRTAEALEVLRLVNKQAPEYEPAFRMLGMFQVEGGNEGQEAQRALEQAVSLDPSDARAHYWLGKALLLRKEFDGALKQFEASLQLEPNSRQAILGHASALRATGQLQTALAGFQGVLQQDPDSEEALLGSARCQYELQQFQAAIGTAEAARQHASAMEDRQTAMWLLARLYRIQNKPQQAEAAEAEVKRLESQKNDNLNRFRSLQEEAARYRKAGDFAKVATVLEQALTIKVRQDSLVVLGDAYRKLGRRKDALSCYLRALQFGPEQKEIRERLEQTRDESAWNVR